MRDNVDAGERFRPTANHLPVLIWISDTDKLCTWFNTTWLAFVGRSLEQEIGNGWAENVHPDDFDACLAVYVASFDAREAFRMEYRLRRHDGEYRWILDEGRPLHDDGGTFVGYIGCCVDISDERRANEDLARNLERERRITHALQAAFLPPYLPKVEGTEIQACYRPAEAEAQLGGDWYDVFVLRDGRVAISIGDVFGHGLEAASAMVRLRETLRAVTGFTDEDPALILQLADHAFQASHPGGIASAVFGIYDPVTRRLTTANAGHPPPVLVRDGVAMMQQTGDAPLGIVEGSRFESSTIVLEAGDALVLYTDGLVEADRDLMGGERKLLAALSGGRSKPEELVSKLTGDKHNDDVAVLIFSLVAPQVQPSWRFQADDAASAKHARNAFEAHLRRHGIDDGAVHAAALVFGELVANVVRHAPGPIEIDLKRESESLELAVRDRGPAFQPVRAALPADMLAEGGRGLFIISRYAQSHRVTPRFGGGNDVRVRLALAETAPRKRRPRKAAAL